MRWLKRLFYLVIIVESSFIILGSWFFLDTFVFQEQLEYSGWWGVLVVGLIIYVCYDLFGGFWMLYKDKKSR